MKYERKAHVLSFVDGMNLLASAQVEIDPQTGETHRNRAVRLNIAQTVSFLSHDGQLPFAKQVLVASSGNGTREPAFNLWRDQGYEVLTLPPAQNGRERGVDEVLHAQAFLALSKTYRTPVLLQLVTGDGNANGGRTTFCDVVMAALRKSPPVKVEICAFKHSLSHSLRALAATYPSVVTLTELDPHRQVLTYRERKKDPMPISVAATRAMQRASSFGRVASRVRAVEEPDEDETLRAALEASLEESFKCPISHEMMTDPVVTADGQTYERASIEKWLADNLRVNGSGHHVLSPMTGVPLAHTNVVPNVVLRGQIRAFCGGDHPLSRAWRSRHAREQPRVRFGAASDAVGSSSSDDFEFVD